MNRDLAGYLVVVVFVSLGMHVHVILFNLYLADLGLREDAMGRLAAAFTLGTAAGTIPAAWMARRFGLRAAILISLGGLALALAWRATAGGAALVAASALAGLFLAGWFVTNAPAIAALSRGATTAFSLNTALAIGVGAVGGIAAGQLPGWLGGASPAAAKRAAILVAAALVGAGAILFLRAGTGLRPVQQVEGLSRPARNPFLLRFLLAVSVWYAFGAGFMPFFNVYLRNRMGASVETIGGVFAGAQVAQAAGALLMAPLIARLGLMRAVPLTQLLSAAGLFALWPVETLSAASALYLIYMSFLVMSEPGLQSLLMSRVSESERAAASAANLLVMFGMQALMGVVSGALIVSRGYGTLFVALGVMGVAAAALFVALFSPAFLAGSAPAASAGRSSAAPRR